jgi:hypothetical protein
MWNKTIVLICEAHNLLDTPETPPSSLGLKYPRETSYGYKQLKEDTHKL